MVNNGDERRVLIDQFSKAAAGFSLHEVAEAGGEMLLNAILRQSHTLDEAIERIESVCQDMIATIIAERAKAAKMFDNGIAAAKARAN